MNFFFVFFISLCLTQVQSSVQVLGPNRLVKNSSWVTSEFVYYGPRSAHIIGQAIFPDAVDMKALCMSRHKGDPIMNFTGLIVIGFYQTTICNACDIYENLIHTGAKAYIDTVFWDPPGFLTFQHCQWRKDKFRSNNLVMISASDPTGSFGNLANADKSKPLILEISPNHSTFYEEKFTSVEWTICIRILAPLFCFATSLFSAYQAYLSRKGIETSTRPSWNVRFVVCSIEAPHILLTGCMLALGHFGPTVLPINFHLACLNVFTGQSAFCSILLLLFLHEEDVYSKSRVRRNIWRQYGTSIPLLFCLLLLSDFFGGYIYLDDQRNMSDALITSLHIFCSFIWFFPSFAQLLIAIFFVVKVEF